MKKTIAVAALLAAAFAAPAFPALADNHGMSAPDTCLILPALKKECWDRAGDMVKGGAEATSSTMRKAADGMHMHAPWNCTRAPAGSGHLFDC